MIQHPWRREELFYYLELLADVAVARRTWVEQNFPAGVQHDCFDFAVNFLFDDTALADAPEKTIGFILEDEIEMHAVTAVIQAIDYVLKIHGTKLTDAQYLNTPEWTQVMETAQVALAILRKTPVNVTGD